MGKVQDIINKLRNEGSVEAQEKALLQIIRTRQAVIIDLNLSQLYQGKDSNNKDIRPEYSPVTVEFKKAKGQPYDRVTLKDEGDFYRGFYLEAEKFPVSTMSSDLKTGKLAEKYSDNELFGFTEESKNEIVQEIRPEVQSYYRSLIHV